MADECAAMTFRSGPGRSGCYAAALPASPIPPSDEPTPVPRPAPAVGHPARRPGAGPGTLGRAGHRRVDDRTGHGRPGLDRPAGRTRLVELGRAPGATAAQARGQPGPRHLAPADRRRCAAQGRRRRTRRPGRARTGVRPAAPTHGLRPQWRRLRARPGHGHPGPAHPHRRGRIAAALCRRRRGALARRQRLVQVERRGRHGAGRLAQGGKGPGRTAQARRPARAATAHPRHPAHRSRTARGAAQPGGPLAQGRPDPCTRPGLAGRRGGDRRQQPVAGRAPPAGGDEEEGRRRRPRRQDADLRHRIGLRGIRGRSHPGRPQRSAAAHAVAGRCRRWQRARTQIRSAAGHRRRPPGRTAQDRRQGAAQGPAPAADWRGPRRCRRALEPGRPPCGGDAARGGQQGPLDCQHRPGQRQAAAAPPPHRPGLDQLELQRFRLAAGQPHPVVPVRGIGLLAPVHPGRQRARATAHFRPLGGVGAGGERGR